MGCDIHMVLERKWLGDTSWTGIWSSDNGPNQRALVAQRDYGLFSRFGVRGSSEYGVIYPRNLPRDVSELAWKCYMESPTDYHSASYCSIDEFVSAYLDEHPDSEDVRKEYPTYDLFKIYKSEKDEYRLVFWFDN